MTVATVVFKFGASIAVVIPKKFALQAGVKVGDLLILRQKGTHIQAWNMQKYFMPPFTDIAGYEEHLEEKLTELAKEAAE